MSQVLEEAMSPDDETGGLSNASLTEDFRSAADEDSGLIEEPLDTTFWPVSRLADEDIEVFVEAVHSVQRDDASAP